MLVGRECRQVKGILGLCQAQRARTRRHGPLTLRRCGEIVLGERDRQVAVPITAIRRSFPARHPIHNCPALVRIRTQSLLAERGGS